MQHGAYVDYQRGVRSPGASLTLFTPHALLSEGGHAFEVVAPRRTNMADASGSALAHLQYYDNRMKECQLTEDETRALDHFRCGCMLVAILRQPCGELQAFVWAGQP